MRISRSRCWKQYSRFIVQPHQIVEGQAELYEKDGTLYLRVLSPTALLSHEEHHPIAIPEGNWMVRIQREYEPQGWRYVAD